MSVCERAAARAMNYWRRCAGVFRPCLARTSPSGSRSRTGLITCCLARARTSPSRSSATTSARCVVLAHMCVTPSVLFPASSIYRSSSRPIFRSSDSSSTVHRLLVTGCTRTMWPRQSKRAWRVPPSVGSSIAARPSISWSSSIRRRRSTSSASLICRSTRLSRDRSRFDWWQMCVAKRVRT